jgi:hypothetical protein
MGRIRLLGLLTGTDLVITSRVTNMMLVCSDTDNQGPDSYYIKQHLMGENEVRPLTIPVVYLF